MIIAIDIGATKTLLTTFTNTGEIGKIRRILTSKDATQFINDINKLLFELSPQSTDILVVACAGKIDISTGIVIYSPNLGWRNFPLRAALAQYYTCPIFISNDAQLAGLGAVRALPKAPPLGLYITVGTGIGSGIIVHGKLDSAFSRSEAGHMVFETPEGQQTWESLASGKAITARFGQLASDITNADDWRLITNQLAIGLRVLIPALQPDIILIGGGVATEFDRFGPQLAQQLRQQLPDFISVPPILQAKDPENTVLHGCYYYALDHIKKTPY